MDLNGALESIQQKIDLQGSRMTEEEADVLGANPDNPPAVCFYAMGLLMNSSVRFKKLFFQGYDELQTEAFALLDTEIKKNNPLAVYLYAEIKCGLFGKFPRYPQEGKALFEMYYSLTGDEKTKSEILDNWDSFDAEMKRHFDDMRIYEVMTDLRNQGFTDFSSHEEAYYEDESDGASKA